LVTNNKVLSRDNLAKRREVEDPSCLFCSEKESVQHLFFDCVVAKQCRFLISEILNTMVGVNLVDIGKFWLINKNTWCVKHHYFSCALVYLETQELALFPENWVEKHGDAAIPDKWSFYRTG